MWWKTIFSDSDAKYFRFRLWKNDLATMSEVSSSEVSTIWLTSGSDSIALETWFESWWDEGWGRFGRASIIFLTFFFVKLLFSYFVCVIHNQYLFRENFIQQRGLLSKSIFGIYYKINVFVNNFGGGCFFSQCTFKYFNPHVMCLFGLTTNV